MLIFFLRSASVLTLQHLRTRYDIIHAHSGLDFEVLASIVARLMGAWVVLNIHQIVPEFYASKFKANEGSLGFRLVLIKNLSAGMASFKTLRSLSQSQVTLGERNAS